MFLNARAAGNQGCTLRLSRKGRGLRRVHQEALGVVGAAAAAVVAGQEAAG